ncbi:MAG: hypothetical protein ACHQ0J_06130 [Candidatus Dormibacterales bacterium]
MSASLVLLVASAASLALALALAPSADSRRSLFYRGVTGLVAMTGIAAAPGLDVVILILLALAVLHSGFGGSRDVAARLQAPIVAVGLLALTLLFVRVQGPEMLGRFAAVGLVAGVAAAVGLLPYMHHLDPGEKSTESAFIWVGFVGPVLGATVLLKAGEFLPAAVGGYFGSMLIGVGLLNVLWGTVAARWTLSGRSAWHYSFMADWGLALCGFGLFISDGRSAALLILIGMVLGRFPLLLASVETENPGAAVDRPVSLLSAAMLAGVAPFTGFAARLLLLRGATQLFWPLAVALTVGMLLWLPASLRLGRSIGRVSGHRAIALAIVFGVNIGVGLYPLPLLRLAQL